MFSLELPKNPEQLLIRLAALLVLTFSAFDDDRNRHINSGAEVLLASYGSIVASKTHKLVLSSSTADWTQASVWSLLGLAIARCITGLNKVKIALPNNAPLYMHVRS